MCEFCAKHGDGGKWYLQAKNYSEDLASDVRRLRTTAEILKHFDDGLGKDLEDLDKRFVTLPAIGKQLVGSLISRGQKNKHFGQVVPIEDVEAIFGIVNSVVRVPCVCRAVTLGKEVRYCLAIGLLPEMVRKVIADGSYDPGPDTSGMDKLSTDEALDFMRDLEKNGVMHSIWTFGTPFIGAVCNCDRSDCVAMRTTVNHGVKVMFKGEYVASVNRDSCTGCRQCIRLCQFGAMGYSASEQRAYIDPLRCFGCGVCRAGCAKDAITLAERKNIPVLANNW